MRSVVALLLALLCGLAHADGTVPGTATYVTGWSGVVTGVTGSSPAAACSALAAAASAHDNTTYTPSVVSGGTYGNCHLQASWGGAATVGIDLGPLSCPAHSVASGGSCACGTGFSPGTGALAGLCVPPTNCPTGSTYSTGWYDIGTDVTVQSTAGCVGGCAYVYDGGSASKTTLENGVKHYWAQGTYTSTGGTCGGGAGDPTAAPAPPAAQPTPTPSTCPAGQALGSVNGSPVCAPTGSPSPASGAATGTPDAPKSTSTSNTTSTTNADGSITKTTTTTTTSAGGAVSTTTTSTTTKPDGSSTSSTTTTGANGTGSGLGSGSTSTGGAGCDPATGVCGEGFPTISDIYTKKDKTLSSVLTSAKDAFMAAPAIAGAVSFMSVSGAGACPQSSWHIPYLNADVTFDFFCTATAISMYAWMRAAVLVAFAVLAFRVAFL